MLLLDAQRLLLVPSTAKGTVVGFKLDGAGAAAATWRLHGGLDESIRVAANKF
jgi:hypothetical protein